MLIESLLLLGGLTSPQPTSMPSWQIMMMSGRVVTKSLGTSLSNEKEDVSLIKERAVNICYYIYSVGYFYLPISGKFIAQGKGVLNKNRGKFDAEVYLRLVVLLLDSSSRLWG